MDEKYVEIFENHINRNEIVSISTKMTKRGILLVALAFLWISSHSIFTFYNNNNDVIAIIITNIIVTIIFLGVIMYFFGYRIVVTTTNRQKFKSPGMSLEKANSISKNLKDEYL